MGRTGKQEVKVKDVSQQDRRCLSRNLNLKGFRNPRLLIYPHYVMTHVTLLDKLQPCPQQAVEAYRL
jgi:hypothetical protein